MRRFWSDPYLWIHAAGAAAVPLWFLLCWLGLAVGDPSLPPWLELGFIAIVGIAPVAWMQSQRPFYIFSLMAVALRPQQLTEDQRRILAIFLARRNPVWIGLAAFVLFLVLKQIYTIAPIAAAVTPFPPGLRGLGLIIAAIGFLGCNLFTQVPLSVVQVMRTSEEDFRATAPISVDQIPQKFLILGFPVNQILPTIVPEASVAPVESPMNQSTEGEVSAS